MAAASQTQVGDYDMTCGLTPTRKVPRHENPFTRRSLPVPAGNSTHAFLPTVTLMRPHSRPRSVKNSRPGSDPPPGYRPPTVSPSVGSQNNLHSDSVTYDTCATRRRPA